MKMQVNIYVDDINFCLIECSTGDGQEKATAQMQGNFSLNESAAINLIAEMVRALTNGERIDRFYKVEVESASGENHRILKCFWTHAGYLQVLDQNTHRKRAHATTVEEAVDRIRTFTCTPELYALIPKRRPSRRDTVPPEETDEQKKERRFREKRTGKVERLRKGLTPGLLQKTTTPSVNLHVPVPDQVDQESGTLDDAGDLDHDYSGPCITDEVDDSTQQ